MLESVMDDLLYFELLLGVTLLGRTPTPDMGFLCPPNIRVGRNQKLKIMYRRYIANISRDKNFFETFIFVADDLYRTLLLKCYVHEHVFKFSWLILTLKL